MLLDIAVRNEPIPNERGGVSQLEITLLSNFENSGEQDKELLKNKRGRGLTNTDPETGMSSIVSLSY